MRPWRAGRRTALQGQDRRRHRPTGPGGLTARDGPAKAPPALGRRQAVRHRLLMPAFAGSNPAAPANGPILCSKAHANVRASGLICGSVRRMGKSNLLAGLERKMSVFLGELAVKRGRSRSDRAASRVIAGWRTRLSARQSLARLTQGRQSSRRFGNVDRIVIGDVGSENKPVHEIHGQPTRRDRLVVSDELLAKVAVLLANPMDWRLLGRLGRTRKAPITGLYGWTGAWPAG